MCLCVLPLSTVCDIGREHRAGLRHIRSAISGQRLIDWLLDEHDITSRDEGLILGSHLMAIGLLKHGMCMLGFEMSLDYTVCVCVFVCECVCVCVCVCARVCVLVTDDHKFKDSAGLYYRFAPDQLVEDVRRGSGMETPTARVDFNSINKFSSQSLLVTNTLYGVHYVIVYCVCVFRYHIVTIWRAMDSVWCREMQSPWTQLLQVVLRNVPVCVQASSC